MKSEKLCDRLKRLRTDRFLTQAELAFKSGVSIQTIWRIENDKGEPYTPTLKVIASALRVPLRNLIGG